MLSMRPSSVWALLAPITPWIATATAAGVMPGADPSVLLHTDNHFYSVESTGGGVAIRKAGELGALGVAEPLTVWTGGDDGPSGVWAPEIVQDEDKFLIYFAAGPADRKTTYAISSDHPGGGYTADETKVKLPDDKWAIDGVLFRYGGELWFTWSGWEGEENVEQNLYICRMASPTEPKGERYIISQPREPWERVVGEPYINEGPEAIVDPAGQLHIVYSADGSWSESYCLADLRLKEGGDPTNVWDWYKSNGCLMGSKGDQMMDGWEKTNEVNGPGHHTFALPAAIDGRSDPGVEHPFMYHAVSKGSEYSWGKREWFAGSFNWVDDITYSRENVPGDNQNVGWSLKFNEAWVGV